MEGGTNYRKYWLALGLTVLFSFSVLGYYGMELYRTAPPIPDEVVSEDGTVLFSGEDIQTGQNVWQSIGGQELGTIWGHGSYQAPDWSADWLHRESLYLAQKWSLEEYSLEFDELDDAQSAMITSRVIAEMRENTYDADAGTITVSADRAEAIDAMSRYYSALFTDAEEWPTDIAWLADGGFSPKELREAYAMADGTVKDDDRMEAMNSFFWWASWSCAAERLTESSSDAPVISYTNNWPAEPLVANEPTAPILIWSILSIFALLAGTGALAWYYAAKKEEDEPIEYPDTDPFLNIQLTPSMRATLKYFWIVTVLILLQVILGIIAAHYTVEGQGFYGFELAKILPFAVVRTWHTQIGIFWIATAWLATGLFVAPIISGTEARHQVHLVNFLFAALLLIVFGSMFGEWYSTRQEWSLEMSFWFGHQGYEYIDLGKFWQIFLFVGLLLWFGMMVRGLLPAFKQEGEHKHMLALFTLSAAAIGLFYGAGLMIGQHTHLAMAEYWRWWVVHLWVEGFFEVFATTVIAFLLAKMGLLRTKTATTAVILSATIFLFGGIIGTFHHLYFVGTPTAVLAWGAVFSALEIVPLTLIGFEAVENLRLAKATTWTKFYKWPIYFFIAVAFWNLVGAGLFGFLINPPIALYYMQGLNTTPVHGHTALFGVYGMLGIGLMLFSLRGLSAKGLWDDKVIKISFWSLNIGISLMVLISLLPVGLLQTVASIDHGMWYARSAEFMQGDLIVNLKWLRIVGDVIFSIGVFSLGYFVAGLHFGWSYIRPNKNLETTE